jgi:hypothetical protein
MQIACFSLHNDGCIEKEDVGACHAAPHVVCRMQELVEKMKECDLNSCAGLLVCSGLALRIIYMDPALEKTLGHPSYVEDRFPPSARENSVISKFISIFAGFFSTTFLHDFWRKSGAFLFGKLRRVCSGPLRKLRPELLGGAHTCSSAGLAL